MNRDVMLKILGALPDDQLLKALQVNGLNVGSEMDDPALSALSTDGPRRWSELKIKRKPDDRPTLSDKDFLEEVAVEEPEMDPMNPFQTGGM